MVLPGKFLSSCWQTRFTLAFFSFGASAGTLPKGTGRRGAERHSFTGVRIGASLPFNSTTTNLAGSVLLALRPTTWTSVGPS